MGCVPYCCVNKIINIIGGRVQIRDRDIRVSIQFSMDILRLPNRILAEVPQTTQKSTKKLQNTTQLSLPYHLYSELTARCMYLR